VSSAYLFPGQGSQHVGMGHELYQTEPASRAVFDHANDLLGFSISEICFSGPEDVLKDTANQQPALLVTSIAALRAMEAREWSPPQYVAGHSLGEFSALVAAGSLQFLEALSLVRKRGELMKKAGKQEPGAMAAILALDVASVEQICNTVMMKTGRPIQVANDNCPGQVVISGDCETLDEAVGLAREAGARRTVKLPISIAAHSPLMQSVSAEFSDVVDSIPIEAPRIPVIGNVSARPLNSVEEIRTELKAQLTSPVLWTGSMNYLLECGVSNFIEVGSGEVLLGLIKRIDRKVNRVKFG